MRFMCLKKGWGLLPRRGRRNPRWTRGWLNRKITYLIGSVGPRFAQFSCRGIFHKLREDSGINFFASHTSPDQIANRHNNEPRWTCLHGYAKFGHPPGGNQYRVERNETEERAPWSRWRKTQD